MSVAESELEDDKNQKLVMEECEELFDFFNPEKTSIDPSMYTAVAVEALGSQLSQEPGSKCLTNRQVYRCFLFLMCVPLFMAQVSALSFLHHDFTEDKAEAMQQFFLLKMLMVVVIYLAAFKYIFATFKQLIFIGCAPCTFDPCNGGLGAAECLTGDIGTPFNWALPFIALLMNAIVNYLVCVDSVSIILGAGSAKDVLADCLAINFILSFGEWWWEFCQLSFHIVPIKDVNCMLPKEGAGGCTPMYKGQDAFAFKRYIPHIAKVLLFLLYSRQFQLVVYAYDTDVVPAVRDLCTMYKSWSNPDTDSEKAWWWFNNIFMKNINTAQLKTFCTICDSNIVENCTISKRPTDRDPTPFWPQSEHSYAFFAFCVILIPVLFPQVLDPLVSALSLCGIHFHNDAEDSAEGTDEDDTGVELEKGNSYRSLHDGDAYNGEVDIRGERSER